MKRIDALRGISDDHHTALIVAARCKRATPNGSKGLEAIWAAVRDGIAGHFEPHFALEEAHLLPALEALGAGDAAERIRQDHAALRSTLATARPSLEEVQAFGKLLERHVRFEEREVFEAHQEQLPEAVREALASAPPRRMDVSRLNALR